MNYIKRRIKSYPLWVAIFSVVALTGQTFGLYQVPEGYDTWVNLVLTVGVAAGIITDPTTEGYKD